MAFSKKASEPYTVISVNDPAIERSTAAGALAARRYTKERDESVLQFRFGLRPARFVCRPLANSARTAIEGIENASLRHQMAFAACVKSVEDLGFPWFPRQIPAAWHPDATMLSSDDINDLAESIGGQVIDEIGAVCLQKANLGPLVGAQYQLPPGYVVAKADVSASGQKILTFETQTPENSSVADSPPTSSPESGAARAV